MNRENILKVADAIEHACKPNSRPKLGFNMGEWHSHISHSVYEDRTGHNCKTVACIGGWAEAIAAKTAAKFASAEEFLGVGYGDLARKLFFGEGYSKNASPQQAVATLRHLAKTGRVNWRAPR